jgi:hypothetical protein
MSHRQFTVAYETVPLDLLISTPKTLRLLLIHKIRETRLQFLLFNWICILLALLAAGICGFNLMPMLLATGVVAEGVFLFLLMLCIDAGDILLDFAREDERFFELATRCHALSIFRRAASIDRLSPKDSAPELRWLPTRKCGYAG